MSRARFPSIAVEIIRRIRQGVYVDKIPSTRALAAEFSSARQTITNVLQLLSEHNFIRTNPPYGMVPVLPEKNEKNKCIGFFCRADEKEFRESSCFSYIENLIAEQGYNTCLKCFRHGVSGHNFDAEFPEDLSGIIIKDSLLTWELSEYFAARNIPIVSCNIMPMIPSLNYVEVDVFHVLLEMADYLQARNYRRVSWFFTSSLESYGDFAQRNWRKIQQQKKLERFPGDLKIVPAQPSRAGHHFSEYLEKLNRSKIKPEVVICSLESPDKYLRNLELEHKDFLPGVIFVSFLERDLEKLDHSMYRTVRFKEVETQLKEALFALEEKMLINNSQPIRRMIKYKFEMFDEIPYKQ